MFEGVHIDKIGAAVVQRVTVAVVTYLVGFGVCNEAVHPDTPPFTIFKPFFSDGITGIGFPAHPPIPLIEEIEVLIIYDCEQSLC